SRMKIDLGNDEEVIAYAPFDIDPQQKKKARKEFSTADVRAFLSQTQAQESWVLLVGHSEHKLNQEFIAVPDVEKLIRVVGNRLLLTFNTVINAVLNAYKVVVSGRKNQCTRIMKVRPEA